MSFTFIFYTEINKLHPLSLAEDNSHHVKLGHFQIHSNCFRQTMLSHYSFMVSPISPPHTQMQHNLNIKCPYFLK